MRTARKDANQNNRSPNCNYWTSVQIHKLHYFLRLNNIPVEPFSRRFIMPAENRMGKTPHQRNNQTHSPD